MIKRDHIFVKITVEEIKEALHKVIKSEHAHLISNTIVEQLSFTEVGIDKLYLSLNGIKQSYKYNVLDEVWVKVDQLPSWRMNKDIMKENGMIFNDYIKCMITAIHPNKGHCYVVRFEVMKDSTKEKSFEEYDIREDAIQKQHPELEGDLLPF